MYKLPVGSSYLTALLILVLSPPLLYAQSFGEAFGVNSSAREPLAEQNAYPTVREFHFCSQDQGYTSDATDATPGYPLNNFIFAATDSYYTGRRGDIVLTALGIAGELRGLRESDFLNGAGLKWFVQKPFAPYGYRVQGPTGFEIGPNFITNSALPAERYVGDWLANSGYNQADPATWRDKARWMSMLATRYGDASLMNQHSGTIGLDDYDRLYYNQYSDRTGPRRSPVIFFEAENEPDRSFFEPGNDVADDLGFAHVMLNTPRTMWQHAPQYLAAQTSMLYDGHGKSNAAIFPPAAVAPAGENGFYYLGVKNVGQKNKVSIGGMAGLRGVYIEEMLDWFITNRTIGQFGFTDVNAPVLPFEALSFHHYAASSSLTREAEYDSYGGQWDVNTGAGQSPELHQLRSRLEYHMNRLGSAFADRGFAQKWEETEIWLSESGYDSYNLHPNPPDNPGPTAYGGIQIPAIPNSKNPAQELDRELLQAQWLTRSYLEIMAVQSGTSKKGVDRFMQFELRDTREEVGPGVLQFQTSGLIRHNGILKPAHYFSKSILSHLEDYDHVYAGVGGTLFPDNFSDAFDLQSAHSSVGPLPFQNDPSDTELEKPVCYSYEKVYGNEDNNKYVIWSPTQQGFAYSIDLDLSKLTDEDIYMVTIHELVDGSELGRPTVLNVTNNVVNIPVSETPMILQFGDIGTRGDVARVDNIIINDMCCGNVEISWARVRRTLRNRVDVYFVLASDVPSSNVVPLRDLTLVQRDFAGTRVLLPNLTPGEVYYVVLLPENYYGYNVDVSAGVSLNPADHLGYLLIPSECDGTDGTSECITSIPSSDISFQGGFNNLSLITTVLNGGLSSDNDNLTCNNIPVSGADNQWTGDGQPGSISATITFDPPVDISSISYLFGGIGTGAQMVAEVMTCTCPFWKEYSTVTPTPQGRSLTRRNLSKVTALRITNNQTNLAGMTLCSTPSSCSGRFFSEEPQVEVVSVAPDRAKLAWSPAFDEASQMEAEDYALALSKSLDSQNKLINPVIMDIMIGKGGALSEQLTGLTPGTSYFGRLLPTRNCLEVAVAPDRFLQEPFTLLDSTFFSFTTEDTSAVEGLRGIKSPAVTAAGMLYSNVFPNPTKSRFKVVAPSHIIHIEIRDHSGRLVSTLEGNHQRSMVINFEPEVSGLFTIQVLMRSGSDSHLVMFK